MAADNGEAVTPERVTRSGFDEWGSRIGTPAPMTRQTAGAVAEAAAKVLARYRRAEERPRNWQQVKERLLAECGRAAFAEVARYELPRGRDTIRGPSIRFAEAAVRIAGNIEIECEITHEDAEYRYLQIRAVDMETNVSFPAPVAIAKTVERKNATGRKVLGERTNASGEVVFIVEANEGEIFLETQRNLSRAMRTCGLRLIPGDIVDAAAAKVRETLAAKDAADPASQLRKLVDAFGQLGVLKRDLRRFLGHDMRTMRPEELERLRGVYTALTEGMDWAEICEQAGVVTSPPAKEPPASGLGLRPGATTRPIVNRSETVGGGNTVEHAPQQADDPFALEEPTPPPEPGVVPCVVCHVKAIRTTMVQTPAGYQCRPCARAALLQADAQPPAPEVALCAGCQEPLEAAQTYTLGDGRAVCPGCLLEATEAEEVQDD